MALEAFGSVCSLDFEKNELSSPQKVRESKNIEMALSHAEDAINQQGLLNSTEKNTLKEFFTELRARYLECSEKNEDGKYSYEILRGSSNDTDDLIILESRIKGIFFPAIQKMAFSRTSGEKNSSGKAGETKNKPDTENIAVDDKELTILIELNAGDNKTFSQVEIEASTSIKRGTLKDKLPRLEKIGLVHRPLGKRKGYQITDKGREIATRHQ